MSEISAAEPLNGKRSAGNQLSSASTRTTEFELTSPTHYSDRKGLECDLTAFVFDFWNVRKILPVADWVSERWDPMASEV